MENTKTSLGKYLFISGLLISLSAYSATPLEQAAASGDLSRVKALVSQGADVNEVDSQSVWEKTPLYAAVEAGHHEVVVYLLSKGADTSRTNAAGSTPLRDAAYRGRAAIVRSLLESGANPDEDTDYYKRSPFVWAVLGSDDGNTADYVSVLKSLREFGATCSSTFMNPVDESAVAVSEVAQEAGPEIADTYAQLCGEGK
jgi:ankyrin repeat protein